MSRVRADDYDLKMKQIMDAAAALFAKTGYPGVKMEQIAKNCKASKSMLYHYFPTKDEILFAILKDHLDSVISAIMSIETSGSDPQVRFLAMVQTFTQKSAQTRRRHVVAMNDVKFLPKAMLDPIQKLETKVLDLVTEYLRAVNPTLDDSLYKPYGMLLIGMMNWTDTWYKPTGAIKPQELVERISRLFLRGFLAEK
ncbi:TetR/AcrR family transcriptional regulator [Janthinobacterium sp. PC23-8]|uniref:TetR/AcrR family transcriptional regulator n=1 Tax=Janthinobacterium sp. PC23-8 TaxID=2012679 RepID=UPI000B972F7B|nr:TetR/AcrR family transcriptional regulator [Janthinobacterium sp. PC23-8]OYO26315.1 hypothetical protein CD932_24025 [Janthinobacterium sp. PC23-8]